MLQKYFHKHNQWVNAARDIGLQGQAHDKEDGDICSKAGFYAGLKLIHAFEGGRIACSCSRMQDLWLCLPKPAQAH